MSATLILLLVITGLLLLLNVPIWAAMLFPAIPYLIINQVKLTAIPVTMSTGTITSFLLLAFPLFTLAGKLMNTGGITRRIFHFASVNFGWIPGGLGHVNVVASMIFAGMSGSAIADIGGLGTIEIEGMTKKGYDLEFSSAITLASSTIGPIIPPSTPIILYAVIANASVAELFLGGIIPGILMGIALMIMVYLYSRHKNYPVEKTPSLKESLLSIKDVLLALLNPVIILMGMVGGIFTPTEAAAVAVAYSVFLGKIVYKELTWFSILREIRDTVKFCGSIYVIVGASLVFSFILTRERVGILLVDYISTLALSPTMVIALLSVLVLFLGCFVEVTALIILILPVIIPIIEAVEISRVYYGVLFIMTSIIGILTPPFGLGLYIVSGMTGMPFKKTTLAIFPFLLPLIFTIILLIIFPDIVLFLPNLLSP